MRPVALLALAGCKVGPNYQPPQMPVEESFEPSARNGVHAALCAHSEPSRDDGVVDHAQRPGPEFPDRAGDRGEPRPAPGGRPRPRGPRPAGDRRRGAISRPGCRRRLLPQPLQQERRPYNAFDVPGFPWGFDLYQAGFDASWELDVFGAVRRSVEAANAGPGSQRGRPAGGPGQRAGGSGAQLRRASRRTSSNSRSPTATSRRSARRWS